MQNQFSRTEILLGTAAMERLARARVAVFGLGGVGGYVVEALVRSGVSALDLIDNDRVCLSNLNRQIIATRQTVGAYKVDAAAARVHDINPQCRVRVYRTFYLPETAAQFDFTQYDYVVDAIDTVSGKLQLAEEAHRTGTPIISCMGAGNKVHPELFEVADIYETSVCPLARVMRRELKRRGIPHLKVVYSREKAITPLEPAEPDCEAPESAPPAPAEPGAYRRAVPGSTAFVPAAAGMILAGEVVRELAGYVEQAE
ncbi:MAG: tRNA threonylcarbamoyladenosine dehydratase [Oscillospiraceae bacterium]|nr:tRNA threonylcarbamoyladenosine dehydratase [Oscillospiraceae bacterium]